MCKYDSGTYDFTMGDATVIPNTIGELWVGSHRAAKKDWCRANEISAVISIIHKRENYPTLEIGWLDDEDRRRSARSVSQSVSQSIRLSIQSLTCFFCSPFL